MARRNRALRDKAHADKLFAELVAARGWTDDAEKIAQFRAQLEEEAKEVNLPVLGWMVWVTVFDAHPEVWDELHAKAQELGLDSFPRGGHSRPPRHNN